MRTNKIIDYSYLIAGFYFILSVLIWHNEYYHSAPVSFVEIDPVATGLADGIKSYQTIKEFGDTLREKNYNWKIMEDIELATPVERPPFHIYTIVIANYSGYGVRGELSITFFNDRLESTVFRPDDFGKLVQYLEENGSYKFDNKGEAILPPFTGVEKGMDHSNRKYIKWRDRRLSNEIDLWIKRHS